MNKLDINYIPYYDYNNNLIEFKNLLDYKMSIMNYI